MRSRRSTTDARFRLRMVNPMVELFWLLLPLAAASGWYAARRNENQENEKVRSIDYGSDYYKGLNYLLNEQPDKAIEVFIDMLAVNSETVETHIALGNLFRRQGEVDRAIRIHQNLIARPTLSGEQRAQALLELGQDYMRAGLFDRAENVFLELIDMSSHSRSALRHLLAIYQQEKDWEKAITTVEQLEKVSSQSMGPVIAQFYCELAEKARAANDPLGVTTMLKRACSSDRNCVRATILLGNLEFERGDYRAAAQLYERVEHQDADYLGEVLQPLKECYQRQDKVHELMDYLQQVLVRYRGILPALILAELIRQKEGEPTAAEFLAKHLRSRPSLQGIDRLIELNLARAQGKEQANLTLLRDLIKELIDKKPTYQCTQCGFTGKCLHWQCPGCLTWGSVKPIHVLRGGVNY